MPSQRQNKRKDRFGESVFFPSRTTPDSTPAASSSKSTPATGDNGSSRPIFSTTPLDHVAQQSHKSPRLSSGADISVSNRPRSSGVSRRSTPQRYTPPAINRPPSRNTDAPGLMAAPHPSLPPVHAASVLRSTTDRPWFLPHPNLQPVDTDTQLRAWDTEYHAGFSHAPFEPFADANEFPFPTPTQVSDVNPSQRVPTTDRIGAFSSLSISSLADTASPPSDFDPIRPGQFDSPVTDAQLETPYTSFHPPTIPNSLDWSARQIRLGRSPSKEDRITSRRDALRGMGSGSAPRHMWEAANQTNQLYIQQEQQTYATPPPAQTSHQRVSSTASRRHSEGTAPQFVDPHDGRVNPSASVPSLGADGISHIATAPRLGLFRLPLIDTSPIFSPNYTFPARSSLPDVDVQYDNALQLTIEDRAPPHQPMSTIEQSIETYDIDPLSPPAMNEAWYGSDPAYTFGASSATSVPPALGPDETSQPEAYQTELGDILAEYELQTEALQLAEEQGVPPETLAAARFFRDENYDLTLCSAPPPSPQQLNSSSLATSSPRAQTEPPIAYYPFRTQSRSTTGSSNSYSGYQEAGDQTISGKALKYLANNELHPDFIAKYRVKEMLGAGGYGFVCVAVQTGYANVAGVEVAVKFLFKHRNGRERRRIPMAGRQPLESFVLQQLDHPGIISCIDVFDDDEMFYMVMELHGHAWEASDHEGRARPLSRVGEAGSSRQAGRVTEAEAEAEVDGLVNPFARPDMPRRASHDLFEAVEHNRFTPIQAKSIFRQIVDAVAYMHERGVYHRDLKDENVVIDRYLHVKLIDFGSVAVEDPTKTPTVYAGDFKGTEAYAPPEVISTDRYTGEGSDIWALGIILAVVLTGDPPIKEEPNHRIRPDRPRLHRQVDPLAYDLIQWCMRGDPDQRADILDVQMHQWFFVPTEDKPTPLWRSE